MVDTEKGQKIRLLKVSKFQKQSFLFLHLNQKPNEIIFLILP